jgi:hypothetical protein
MDLALAIAFMFAVGLVVFLARALRPPRACHYCDRPQSPRHLRRIELSEAGVVDVCIDAAACRTRHQEALAR